jgi:hypothetical protein
MLTSSSATEVRSPNEKVVREGHREEKREMSFTTRMGGVRGRSGSRGRGPGGNRSSLERMGEKQGRRSLCSLCRDIGRLRETVLEDQVLRSNETILEFRSRKSQNSRIRLRETFSDQPGRSTCPVLLVFKKHVHGRQWGLETWCSTMKTPEWLFDLTSSCFLLKDAFSKDTGGLYCLSTALDGLSRVTRHPHAALTPPRQRGQPCGCSPSDQSSLKGIETYKVLVRQEHGHNSITRADSC